MLTQRRHAPLPPRAAARGAATLVALCLFFGVAAARAAHAQFVLDFSLNPSSRTGTPGDRLSFFGTLTNRGTTTVFLNGLSGSLGSPDLFVDDSPFFAAGFPRSLDPNVSFTGNIFDVVIGSSAQGGTYNGSVTIQGGADASAQDNLATAAVSVAVVPEPSSLALLGLGGIPLPLIAAAARRRRGGR